MMRSALYLPTIFAIMASLAILQGCSTTTVSSPAPATVAVHPATPPATQPSVAEAKARAERLAKELAEAEVRSRRARLSRNPSSSSPTPSTQPAHPASRTTHPIHTTTQPTTQPSQGAPPRLTRAQLIDELRHRIAVSNESAQQKAALALGLSLLQPNMQMNERLLTSLKPHQRREVGKVHQLLVYLTQRVAQGQPVTQDLIDDQLNHIFSDAPIQIHRLELCKQVVGFGVYEPFEHNSFLAGVDHKMIVYVELRHYRCMKNDAGQYQVKLKQKVTLFNQSDGLVVWQHKPVQIVDTSRDRRHDFFVVQLIDLPANLSVGKYRLKVRVTDEQGGSLDEKTLGLEIVADKALLGK